VGTRPQDARFDVILLEPTSIFNDIYVEVTNEMNRRSHPKMSRFAATFIALAPAGATSPAKSESLPKGTRIVGKLTTKLDTKHAQAGQPVVIEITKDVKSVDQILLKKGSLIRATLAQVQSFSKGKSSAALELALDGVVPRGGEQFTVPAIASAASSKMPELFVRGSRGRCDRLVTGCARFADGV
jgi:hypothetical protein